jgi:hypothetical protein
MRLTSRDLLPCLVLAGRCCLEGVLQGGVQDVISLGSGRPGLQNQQGDEAVQITDEAVLQQSSNSSRQGAHHAA